MAEDPGQIDRLARIAQIRADAELKRFAAFRAHVDALHRQHGELRAHINQGYGHAEDSFSVIGLRLAAVRAGRLARETSRIEAELARLAPGFDAARARAARE
ncbi:MAG: hypothetical protein Q4G25_08370, partial [Paracoccus sp. (in: a-proteobacteria)]|nr:hypothetical protein [Paracoccus sp. (in: a-proteobacteria)]